MSNDNKTIWIINQYASHLETRHLELAKSFAQSGYTVAVITTSFHHGKREYMYEQKLKTVRQYENIYYVYLHSGPSYKTNGAGRILNMIDFCRLVLKYHKRLSEEIGIPRYIIASSAPPFVWEAGYKLAKRYNAKFAAELRDIWPLSLVEIQGINPKHPLVKVLGRIEKRAYERADAIVSTMQYASDHICETDKSYKAKVHWMANGINTGQVDRWLEEYKALPPDLEKFLSEHWCCVYVGSIVRSECVDYLVKAISGLADDNVYFAIVGEGHEKQNIQALIDEKNIRNVKLFPFLERKYIPAVLHKAKCCVAADKDVGIGRYGLSMYKLSDYLYSGTPTVFAYDLKSVVTDAGHYSVPYGDEDKLRDVILSVKNADEEVLKRLAQKGKEEILQHYDFKKIGKSYLEVLENC